jgi:prepilin-type N-terminal cleavage/methylation domain-containing protein
MTVAAAAHTVRPAHRRRGRRAFTLVEILVVIGIIVLLAAIALPLIARAMRQARATATASDMQTITQALESFKADHGDYPREIPNNAGFAVLARHLHGAYGDGVLAGTPPPNDPDDPPAYDSAKTYKPGDAVQTGTTLADRWVALIESTGVNPGSDDRMWVQYTVNDGVDGVGFKLRDGGKKLAPYLREGALIHGCSLVDGEGAAILYFPARPGKPNFRVALPAPNGTVGTLVDRSTSSYYNADHNFEFFRRAGDSDALTLQRIQAMLGDSNASGGPLDADENPATEAPFILWAPGTDGLYGPTKISDSATENRSEVSRCDDVTNYK